MKMKHQLSFLVFFFIVISSWSHTLDSLKKELQTPKLAEIEQAKINYQIAEAYVQLSVYDSAIVYSSNAIDGYKKLNVGKEIIDPLTLHSFILKKKGFNSLLFSIHGQLIRVLIKYNDTMGLMSAYDKMGLYYYHIGIIDSAIYYYNKAYEIGSLKNNSKALMDSYNNISQVYNYQGEYEKELEYLKKGLEIAVERNENYSRATFYHNIALSYINLEQFDSAMQNISKAININTLLNETDRLALNKTALGNIYAMQGEVLKAMGFFNEALLYFTTSGNLSGQIESNYNLGFSYYYLEDYHPAQKYFFEALRLSKMINHTAYQIELYQQLSQVYSAQEDYKKSLFYYKQYTSINDSLIRSTNIELVSKIQTEFEYDRNMIEIKLLSKENELKDRKVLSVIVIASISIVSFIVMLFFLAFIFRKLRRNEELHSQLEKKSLDIQNNHDTLKIFESEVKNDFEYAKNLQQYFYSDASGFKNIFNEYYFKSHTKNFLSNSFLWTNKLGNKLYWALITINYEQHKGAYTGMYLYNMLNKVFLAKKFSDVESFSKIFITESLSQEKSLGDIQMLFCSLDIKKSEMHFVNIGIDVELFRNAKVWEFKAPYSFISVEKADSLFSNKIQLQYQDELIFFSKNWPETEKSFSAGKEIYNQTIASKSPDHLVFLQELEESTDIDDFVFLLLKK